MKLLFLGALFMPLIALAQTSGDNIVEASPEHVSSDPAPSSGSGWQVQDGSDDVQGESAFSTRDAKKTWKKACEDWKKEFRQDNKENKIIHVSCGNSKCGGEAGDVVCTSKATYKIKTKAD